MSLTLKSSVAEISGVGSGYASKLKKLGIETVSDLLFYFPRRWDDFSYVTPIGSAKANEAVSVKGRVLDIQTKKTKRGRTITELIISDGTGNARAIFFNQPFLEKSIKKEDEIYLAGKLEWSYGGLAFNSPAHEKGKDAEDELRHVGRVVPVYPETAGLTSKWIRQKVGLLTKLVYNIKDHLPNEVKQRHRLMDLSATVRAMHFPENLNELKEAKKRLLYDDLFCLLTSVLLNKKEVQENKAVVVTYDEKVGTKFVESLPYSLTDAQRKAAWDILKDIGKSTPMNRLLEGDVGSGKTVVAAMAALMVAKTGYQTAILAPTEILASQHYKNLKELLSDFNVKLTLLTGGMKKSEKDEVLKNIENGDTNIVIGTHALLSEGVNFWTLALVIIDEQHRFGVEQRKALKKVNGKSKTVPHFLSMSATPIPRTLAITVFGDLDLSILDEMPPGREKVETYLVPPEKRSDGYKFIDKKIEEGRQIFVICPLVSASDKLGVKSAEEEKENLRKVFSKRKVGLLHGRMKREEKELIMKNFKNKKIDILVSTSVIEVGVDVPNASIMLIEGAERFGLAQLHQFRGRVGRGKYKSYCLLFTDSKTNKTLNRLQALIESQNGFELAERDLELRGPGELLGVKQHGKIDETLTQVIPDPRAITVVKETAEKFVEKYDISEFPLLVEKLGQFENAKELE